MIDTDKLRKICPSLRTDRNGSAGHKWAQLICDAADELERLYMENEHLSYDAARDDKDLGRYRPIPVKERLPTKEQEILYFLRWSPKDAGHWFSGKYHGLEDGLPCVGGPAGSWAGPEFKHWLPMLPDPMESDANRGAI